MLKEEGELSDEDDIALLGNREVGRRKTKLKRDCVSTCDRRLMNTVRETQRFSDFPKSCDHTSIDKNSSNIPSLMELSVQQTKPLSHTSAVPSDFSQLRSLSSSQTRPKMRPEVAQPSRAHSAECWSHPLYESHGSDNEFQELLNSYSETQKRLHGLRYQPSSVAQASFKANNDDDARTSRELVVIDDDDADEDGLNDSAVVECMENQEDEDLDELQLRRDALSSAFKSSKSCTSSSNGYKLLNSEGLEQQCWDVSHSQLNTENSLTAATACGDASGIEFNSCQDVVHDNYDEVEMDLDSGSDSETVLPGSFERELQRVECMSSASVDTKVPALMNLPLPPVKKTVMNPTYQNNTGMLQSSPGSNSVLLLVSEPSVLCNTASGDNLMFVDDPEDAGHKCAADGMADADKVSRETRLSDADEKSMLLLREAVLQSQLSSRKQQQQSQVDGSTPADAQKTCKSGIHAIKHVATSTLSNQNLWRVHRPVIIPVGGESSDSDGVEQLEVPVAAAASCDLSSTVATSNTLDGVLHAIRLATEEPQSHVCDAAQVCSISTALSQHKYTTPKPGLAVTLTVSNNACIMLQGSAVSSTSKPEELQHSTSARDAVKLHKNDSTGNKNASCRLEEEILCEKRKLEQQKKTRAKTRLKILRKKEQINAAEKRVKKMREELAAAEKIAASAKKQLETLHDETITLSRSIEQSHKNIDKLEARLLIPQKNRVPVPFVHETIGDLLQTSSPAVSSTLCFSCDINVGCEHATNPVDCKNPSCSARETFSAVTGSRPSVTNTRDCGLRFRRSRQTHNSISLATCSSDMSAMLEDCKHLWGVSEAEALLKDKSLQNELTSQENRDEIEPFQVAQQVSEISGDSSQETAGISHSSEVAVSSRTKPHFSGLVPQQKSLGTFSGESAVVSDDVSGSNITSALLDDFVLPSDKKIKQILLHYNSSLNRTSSVDSVALYSRLFATDPVLAFPFPVDMTSLDTGSSLPADSQLRSFTDGDGFYRPYRSRMLCLRSYRFSKWFQQSVLSATWSHKLDSAIALCQFDLMGKCLDDACPWQHQSDYVLTSREHLIDIVSYCPSAAGLSNSTPARRCKQLLNQYVERFLKEMCAGLVYSDQCERLIEHVKTASQLCEPHAISTSPRCWKLSSGRQCAAAVNDGSDSLFSAGDALYKLDSSTLETAADVRYWMLAESDDILTIEDAVATAPDNARLWSRLACAKMMEVKWSASHDDCISYGLDVLRRAVEANPSNSQLWREYLDLYVNRSDAEADVASLYEQAVQYAPSYEFFWKYLRLQVSYSQKMNVCKRLRQYLCSPQCRDDASVQSHQLLETVLYQAHLSTMSGRFSNGLQVIQAIVQSKASVIWLKLTSCDRIVMWLAFLHLYEFQELPKMLYDPANSNAGVIVRKEPFTIPFQQGRRTHVAYETLSQLFESACGACERESITCDEYVRWVAALYHSRILLELSCRGSVAARQLSQQVLVQHSHLVDIWIVLLQLIVTSDEVVNTVVLSSIEQALTVNAHSVTLFLAAVSALIHCGQTNDALNYAERCPISLFDVDQLDPTSVDPNLLYSCLLGQPVPADYRPPALHQSVSWQYVAEQQLHLWLCFCLLLDLQGAHDQATETYQLALSCLHAQHDDVGRLWLAFLRRSLALISRQLAWLRPAGGDYDKTKLWLQFESDVGRALSSLPVRRCLPYASSQTWDDYSLHNEIVLLHLSCVRHLEAACENYLRRMPANVDLLLKTVNCLLKRRSERLCRGLCLVAVHNCPRALSLWNVALRLNRRSASVGLMRSLYARATTVLPLSANLWKLRVMFELINKSQQHAHQVLERCCHLQVNVGSFVDSLLN